MMNFILCPSFIVYSVDRTMHRESIALCNIIKESSLKCLFDDDMQVDAWGPVMHFYESFDSRLSMARMMEGCETMWNLCVQEKDTWVCVFVCTRIENDDLFDLSLTSTELHGLRI